MRAPFVAFLSAFFFAAGGLAQETPAPDAPEKTHVIAAAEDHWWSWIEEHDKLVVAAGTIVIAAFTVVLAVATYLLWKAGEKHSRRELRAWIFITKAGVHGFVAGHRPSASVEITNMGKSPALDLDIRMTFETFDWPRTVFTHRPAVGGLSKASLGAGGSVDSHGEISEPLEAGTAAEVQCGKKAVFVFGEITYRDVFDYERRTNFRFYFRGNGSAHSPNLLLTPAEQGNEAA